MPALFMWDEIKGFHHYTVGKIYRKEISIMAKKKYRPMSYVKFKKPGRYKSAYQGQINTARDNLMNWTYDPMKDANYQALASVYAARGNQAAQDTLGDAASLNGGYGTSYAVSAAQQARNQYNQELMSLVPDLEQNAYARAQNNYNVLMDADQEAYTRFRDRMADYQWGKGYDTDVYQYRQQQKKNRSGGGGGGHRGGGGGGGYYSGGGGGSYGGGLDLDSLFYKAQDETEKKKKAKNKITGNGTVSYGQAHGKGRVVK